MTLPKPGGEKNRLWAEFPVPAKPGSRFPCWRPLPANPGEFRERGTSVLAISNSIVLDNPELLPGRLSLQYRDESLQQSD